MKKETFTTREAAEALGVTSARVRQMVLDGSLPAEKFGHLLVIKADGIESARQRKTAPGPVPKSPTQPANDSNAALTAAAKAKKKGKK